MSKKPSEIKTLVLTSMNTIYSPEGKAWYVAREAFRYWNAALGVMSISQRANAGLNLHRAWKPKLP